MSSLDARLSSLGEYYSSSASHKALLLAFHA